MKLYLSFHFRDGTGNIVDRECRHAQDNAEKLQFILYTDGSVDMFVDVKNDQKTCVILSVDAGTSFTLNESTIVRRWVRDNRWGNVCLNKLLSANELAAFKAELRFDLALSDIHLSQQLMDLLD